MGTWTKRIATVLFPLGLLAAPAWPANDFTGDENCAALWCFDSGGFLTDSIGTNTLMSIPTDGGPDANTVDYQEGSASADFELSYLDKLLYIHNADLDVGFPLKSGDLNKRISVAAWFKLRSLPAANQSFRILEKAGTNQNSFFIAIYTDLDYNAWFYLGIGTGASAEWIKFAPAPVVADRWYHFGVTFQNVGRSYRIRIWDDTAGALLGEAEQTGTTGHYIYVGTGDLILGVHNVGMYWKYDGLLDELVVFNDILTAGEIDLIRAGTYGN